MNVSNVHISRMFVNKKKRKRNHSSSNRPFNNHDWQIARESGMKKHFRKYVCTQVLLGAPTGTNGLVVRRSPTFDLIQGRWNQRGRGDPPPPPHTHFGLFRSNSCSIKTRYNRDAAPSKNLDAGGGQLPSNPLLYDQLTLFQSDFISVQ